MTLAVVAIGLIAGVVLMYLNQYLNHKEMCEVIFGLTEETRELTRRIEDLERRERDAPRARMRLVPPKQ